MGNNETLHVVRLTVLSLDGITYLNNNSSKSKVSTTNNIPSCDKNNNLNCKGYTSVKKKYTFPEQASTVPEPNNLRAFIYLSRTETLSTSTEGNFCLSQSLCKSHKHSVIKIAYRDEFEISNDDEFRSTAKESSKERYVANWSSVSNVTTGRTHQNDIFSSKISLDEDFNNTITFETYLERRKESSIGKKPTYEPKSYNVTVGLVSIDGNPLFTCINSSVKMLFGIPLGMAKISINGDECSGRISSNSLDFPVTKLVNHQQSPFADSEDSMSCTISPSNNWDKVIQPILLTNQRFTESLVLEGFLDTEEEGSDSSLKCPKSIIKGKMGRWFRRGSNKVSQHSSPSSLTNRVLIKGNDKLGTVIGTRATQINMFMDRYDIEIGRKNDEGACLRLSIEVYEKGSEQEIVMKVRMQRRWIRAKTIAIKTLIAAEEAKVVLAGLGDDDISSINDEETFFSWDEYTMSTKETNITDVTEVDSMEDDVTLDSLIDESGTLDSTTISSQPDVENIHNVGDEEDYTDCDDETHLTLEFQGRKVKVFTPNPLHIAYQGVENALDIESRARKNLYESLIGGCKCGVMASSEKKSVSDSLTFVSHLSGRDKSYEVLFDNEAQASSPQYIKKLTRGELSSSGKKDAYGISKDHNGLELGKEFRRFTGDLYNAFICQCKSLSNMTRIEQESISVNSVRMEQNEQIFKKNDNSECFNRDPEERERLNKNGHDNHSFSSVFSYDRNLNMIGDETIISSLSDAGP